MKERPILFSGAIVRAILDGRKTQTRRVVKAQGVETDDATGKALFVHHPNCPNFCDYACGGSFVERGIQTWRWAPYGIPGDRMWVRETWGRCDRNNVIYRADDIEKLARERQWVSWPAWTPSIFMPRWASRITLDVVGVHVERLQDISEEGCRAEGCVGGNDSIPGYEFSATPREHYRHLWNSINGKTNPWDSNPWVWVVEFTKATTEPKSLEVGTCAAASTQ